VLAGTAEGPAYIVLLSDRLRLLLSVTLAMSDINSSYYPFFFLPVVTEAEISVLGRRCLWTALVPRRVLLVFCSTRH